MITSFLKGKKKPSEPELCYAALILSIVAAASTLLLHQASNHLLHNLWAPIEPRDCWCAVETGRQASDLHGLRLLTCCLSRLPQVWRCCLLWLLASLRLEFGSCGMCICVWCCCSRLVLQVLCLLLYFEICFPAAFSVVANFC